MHGVRVCAVSLTPCGFEVPRSPLFRHGGVPRFWVPGRNGWLVRVSTCGCLRRVCYSWRVTFTVCACALCRSPLVISVGLHCVYNVFHWRAQRQATTLCILCALCNNGVPPSYRSVHASTRHELTPLGIPSQRGTTLPATSSWRRPSPLGTWSQRLACSRIDRLWLPSASVLFLEVARLLGRPCVVLSRSGTWRT